MKDENKAMKAVGETDLGRLTEIIQKEMLATLEELSEYDPDEIDGIAIQDYEDDEEETADDGEALE